MERIRLLSSYILLVACCYISNADLIVKRQDFDTRNTRLTGPLFNNGLTEYWDDSYTDSKSAANVEKGKTICRAEEATFRLAGYNPDSCTFEAFSKGTSPSGDYVIATVLIGGKIPKKPDGTSVTDDEFKNKIFEAIREFIKNPTERYYIAPSSMIPSPIRLVTQGDVFTFLGVALPFTSKFTEDGSSIRSNFLANLCKSIQDSGTVADLKVLKCDPKNIRSNADGKTVAEMDIQVAPVTLKTNKRLNTADVMSKLQEELRKYSERQLSAAYYGNQVLVKWPNEFLKDDVSLTSADRSQTVSWPSKPSDCTVTYKVLYRESGTKDFTKLTSGCNNKLTVPNLKPGTKYEYQVEAYNSGDTVPVSVSNSIEGTTTNSGGTTPAISITTLAVYPTIAIVAPGAGEVAYLANGFVRTRGNSPLAYDTRLANPTDPYFSSISSELCKNLVEANKASVKMLKCQIVGFTNKDGQAAAAAMLTYPQYSSAGEILDPTVMNQKIVETNNFLSTDGTKSYYFDKDSQAAAMSSGNVQNVQVNQVSENSNLVNWKKPDDTCSYDFVVEYKVSGTNDVKTKNVGCNNNAALDDLSPGVLYSHRVVALIKPTGILTTASPWIEKITLGENPGVISLGLDGPVQAIGNIGIPYQNEFDDLNSKQAMELSSTLCKNLKEDVDNSGYMTKSCEVISFTPGPDGNTQASIKYDISKSTTSGKVISEEEGIAKLKAIVAAEAVPTNPNAHLGSSTSVGKNYDSTLTLKTTSPKSINVSWANLPDDCTFIYKIEYQLKGNTIPNNVNSKEAGCRTSVEIDGLEQNPEKYEYRLVRRNPADANNNKASGKWFSIPSEISQGKGYCRTGCIVAAVLGSLAGLALLSVCGAFLGLFLCKKKKEKNAEMMLNETVAPSTFRPSSVNSFTVRNSVQELGGFPEDYARRPYS